MDEMHLVYCNSSEGGTLTGTGSQIRGVVILSNQMDFALFVCDTGLV